jgi:hypothetical protein
MADAHRRERRPVTAEFLRDAAATAAIFGFFASAWFGWAQDEPPPGWRKALVAGSILSLLTAVGGGVVTWRNWSGPDGVRRRYQPYLRSGRRRRGRPGRHRGRGPGQAPERRAHPRLGRPGRGVHLIPVALLARSRPVAVSAVTGLGAGTVLLAAALWSLASALRWP